MLVSNQHAHAMSLRPLLTLSSWPDLAIEALLQIGGTVHSTAQSIWALPSGLRGLVRIRWPRIYVKDYFHVWGNQLRDMLKRHVDVVTADLPQPYRGTIQCECEIDRRTHKLAFNVSDYPDVIDERCTRESLLTFKFQFRDGGYPERRIVPGGYLPRSALLYKMLTYLRWSKDHRRPQFDVYGRFGMEFSPGIRGDVLRRMTEGVLFRFHGGMGRVRYSRYLREVARSRVCLDLPGQGPLCFRLIEYLAVGSAIVARPHCVVLPGCLVDGVHIAYCRSGSEEMVQRCKSLLDVPGQERAMVAATRDFFDRYLHRDQLSAYYVNLVLAAAGVS